MTREQVEKCKVYEQQFSWAVKTNFLRMNNTEFGAIAAIYKEVFGKELNKSQMTCNTCRLRAIKELGTDYFSSRDKYTLEDRKIEQEKPKRGRPRKIDLDNGQTEPKDADKETSEGK